ncbi:hypothetical protein [Hyalangium versicolor]|uniref:hypothetical protein n=1 Tax=Hyalangium versicolor TaxID=2861190 RepID=UPI001CCA8737|nr:hypothetical protein [Hyalangium versicolor]
MNPLGISDLMEWFRPLGRRPATDDRELMSRMLFLATGLSVLPLRRFGAVPPFGVTLDSHGENLHIYFPLEQDPDARWRELIDATTNHLERRIASEDVGVLAIAAELESDDRQGGLGIHLETRTSSLFVIYPYKGTRENRRLGECSKANGLFVAPLLAAKKQ